MAGMAPALWARSCPNVKIAVWASVRLLQRSGIPRRRGRREDCTCIAATGRLRTGKLRMRRSRHTDQEVAFLLKEAAAGTAIAEICSAAHVSIGTFYRWRRRLGGLPPEGVERLGQVERENARLRDEVLRLRSALRAASTHASDARRAPGAKPDNRIPAPVHHRGGAASVGRYAFVRGAN
ncbi:transposase [Methylobacterium sp. WL116]|nr:transposase [Methylobacterium sp. WL116]